MILCFSTNVGLFGSNEITMFLSREKIPSCVTSAVDIERENRSVREEPIFGRTCFACFVVAWLAHFVFNQTKSFK